MFKILTFDDMFNRVTDMVKTEQNIFELLFKEKNRLSENFGYIGVPIADNINKFGVPNTQKIINDIENKFSNFKKIYVCQHIHVNLLNFYNNTVFTPHSLNSDKRIVIPHYNALIRESEFIPAEKRKYRFSFFGAFNSHPVRGQLMQFNSVDTPVMDTGAWHYYKTESEREKFKNSYIDNLCQTVFSLCPEGTGVSTIRLYESMASGSIPVLFNDVKVPEIVEPYCLRTTVNTLEQDLNNFSDVNDKCQKLHEIYWKNLSNDMMMEYILKNV